jgi:transposase-like protein
MSKHMQQTSVKQTSVKVRRKFDETFKREAVQHWLQSGKSAEVIAQELGLKANRIYAWKQCFAPAAAGGGRQRGRSPARWRTCKASWTRPCARTGTCASSATF